MATNAMLTRPPGLGGAVLAYCLTQVVVATLTVMAFRRYAGSGIDGNRELSARGLRAGG